MEIYVTTPRHIKVHGHRFYNSVAGVVDSSATSNRLWKVNPLEAVAAATGYYTFKDVEAGDH